jgi:hypothetical protein
MRALDISIKADFIKKDNLHFPKTEDGSSGSRVSSRPTTAGNPGGSANQSKTDLTQTSEDGKKPRPKSFTGFTLGRGDGSNKKAKHGRGASHGRNKSVEIPRSNSSTSLNSVGSSSSFNLFGRSSKVVTPDDFISYLKKAKKPQDIEIGKIQKLWQLLRNETVAWVDEFVTEGGMIELVNIVYRIIDIEWR